MREIILLSKPLLSGTLIANQLLQATAIDGFAGTGKTTDLIKKIKSGDLLISRTAANVNQLKVKLAEAHKEGVTVLSLEKSYEFESIKPYNLFIDEAGMVGYLHISHLLG